MADLERLARAQRRVVLDVDAELARQLVDAYTRAWGRLRVQLDALTADIAAAGADASPGWLVRQERLRSLEQQIVAEVGQIARSANGAITVAQWEAVRLAQEHAREAVALAMGEPPVGVAFSFNQVPHEAVRALVGTLADGRPLSTLLDQLGPEASAAVREALTDGVLLGEGPAQIARRARSAFGGNAVRATTVARTEVIRSYKAGSLASYRANSDVVKGWIWIASLSPRTCAACVALHGSEHALDEEFHDHPRGRCAAAPLTRSWAELGFDVPDAAPPVVQSGADWFAAQPAHVQQRIAGRAKAAAIRSGAIALEDLAASTTDAWGKVLREKSLTSIVGAERTRELITEARS